MPVRQAFYSMSYLPKPQGQGLDFRILRTQDGGKIIFCVLYIAQSRPFCCSYTEHPRADLNMSVKMETHRKIELEISFLNLGRVKPGVEMSTEASKRQ